MSREDAEETLRRYARRGMPIDTDPESDAWSFDDVNRAIKDIAEATLVLIEKKEGT